MTTGSTNSRFERQKEQMDIYSGMPATDLPPVRWQKSRWSNANGNCVEMAKLASDAGIAVRNSRDPNGPVLVYTMDEIVAFVLGAKDGDFDHLLD
jgi:Domain of unknown function (DUF397)